MRFRKPGDRGVAVVIMVVLLVVIDFVIVATVLGSARNQVLTGMHLETSQSYYAAEAGMNMAIRELFQGMDEDGDGTIGSISDNGLDADNPTVGAVAVYVQGVTSGAATLLSSRAGVHQTRRHLSVTMDGQPSDTNARNLLFVVSNAANLSGQDQSKKSQMEAWGYVVTPISDSESQAVLDAAVAINNVVYLSEEISSGQLNTKLRDAAIGIVSEESRLNKDLGISSKRKNYDSQWIDVVNNTHYITFLFGSGPVMIANPKTNLNSATGKLAGGAQVLSERVSKGTPSLVVIETGAPLQGGGSAAGRRVMLPFGGNKFKFDRLNVNGLTLMRRAIEWTAKTGTGGLVGHWKLDEGSGTTTADAVGSNNGVINLGTWASGKLTNALSFNGSFGSVAIPNAPNLQLTDALTIAGWVNGNTWGSVFDVDIIARKGDNNPNNYQLAIDNGRVNLFLDGNDNSTGFSGNTLLNSGQWYHVAGTWDGSTVKIYVDGVLDHSAYARTGSIGKDSRNLYIAGRGGTDVIDGRVDDVRLYDRALSDAEVAALAKGAIRVTSWQETEP